MRWLYCLVPWMAMTAAWAAGPTQARLAYSHFDEKATEVIRDGEGCWVPLAAVQPYGWKSKIFGDTAEILAEGRTVRVPVRYEAMQTFISMHEAARQLGAIAAWNENTFVVSGQLRMVDIENNRLRADATLTFKSNVFLLENPKRLVVDLIGTHLSDQAAKGLPAFVRVGQPAPNVTRIVIEHNEIGMPTVVPTVSARFIDLNLGQFDISRVNTSVTNLEPPFGTPPVLPPTQSTTTGSAAQTPPRELRAVSLEDGKADRETVALSFNSSENPVPKIQISDPTNFSIDLPRTVLTDGANKSLSGQLVASTTAEAVNASTVRFRITSKQPVVFQLSNSGSQTLIVLRRPKNANGTLVGKTIVIDPGHGGNDSGAHWKASGTSEKTVVLKVSRYLAEELINEGANVIMTRNTDVRIGLNERAEIANRNQADAFISVHVNSNKVNNSRSGTITFHHMQEPDGKLLANVLHKEIVKGTQLPNIGVWSDSRIYRSGFAVLRVSKVPSVLLELGFVNHSTDRGKMVQDDWQRRVASSIVNGLRIYFGNVKEEKAP